MAFRVFSVARRFSWPQPPLMHYGSQQLLCDCTSSSHLFNRLTQSPNFKFIHESPAAIIEAVKRRMEHRIKEARCEVQEFETMSTEFHATSAKLRESLLSKISKVEAFDDKIKLRRTTRYVLGLAFFCLGYYC